MNLEDVIARRASALDAMDQTPPAPQPAPQPEPPAAPQPAPAPQPEPTPPAPQPEPPAPAPEPTPGDIGEVDDFTKPVDRKERESLAQKRAAENGRRAKELEKSLADRELELNKLRTDLEEARKSSAPRMPDEREILSQPEIVSIRESVRSDVQAVASTQDVSVSGTVITERFTKYIGDWMEAADDQAKVEAFRKSVAEDFLAEYRKSADHDPDSEREFTRDHVKAVLGLVVRNHAKVKEIQDKVQESLRRASDGVSTFGAKQWEDSAEDLRRAANSVVLLPDDVDPMSVGGFVKAEVSTDEGKARFQKIVDTVTTAFLGPKVLTEKELEAVKQSGISPRDFIKRREKQHLENRKKIIAQISQALFVSGEWEGVYADAMAYRQEQEERERLRGPGIKDRDPEPKVEAPKPVTRETFRSAIEGFLD